MSFDTSKSTGFLANHMARLFATDLGRRVQPLGLAPAQFMVLLQLWDHDGLTQADLVTRLDVEQATMANTLKRMERDGLVVRVASDSDRRARLVRMTDRARGLQAAATAAAAQANEAALGDLTAEERDALIALMTRVITRLRRVG